MIGVFSNVTLKHTKKIQYGMRMYNFVSEQALT